jgi:hypothetical protein
VDLHMRLVGLIRDSAYLEAQCAAVWSGHGSVEGGCLSMDGGLAVLDRPSTRSECLNSIETYTPGTPAALTSILA